MTRSLAASLSAEDQMVPCATQVLTWIAMLPSHIRQIQKLIALFSAVVPEIGAAWVGGANAETSVRQCGTSM
jgi:hypothetical protein